MCEICSVETKKIVITGAPGTGKTSLIEALKKKGYFCLDEISRQVTREAQKKGISQLFLKDPLLFSELLLEGRVAQYLEAKESDSEIIFLDRGIPDISAYMDYFGNNYPPEFKNTAKNFPYDEVFLLPPWEDIYISDEERYESFEQARVIHDFIAETYISEGYQPIELPHGTIEERVSFLLDRLPVRV